MNVQNYHVGALLYTPGYDHTLLRKLVLTQPLSQGLAALAMNWVCTIACQQCDRLLCPSVCATASASAGRASLTPSASSHQPTRKDRSEKSTSKRKHKACKKAPSQPPAAGSPEIAGGPPVKHLNSTPTPRAAGPDQNMSLSATTPRDNTQSPGQSKSAQATPTIVVHSPGSLHISRPAPTEQLHAPQEGPAEQAQASSGLVAQKPAPAQGYSNPLPIKQGLEKENRIQEQPEASNAASANGLEAGVSEHDRTSPASVKHVQTSSAQLARQLTQQGAHSEQDLGVAQTGSDKSSSAIVMQLPRSGSQLLTESYTVAGLNPVQRGKSVQTGGLAESQSSDVVHKVHEPSTAAAGTSRRFVICLVQYL